MKHVAWEYENIDWSDGYYYVYSNSARLSEDVFGGIPDVMTLSVPKSEKAEALIQKIVDDLNEYFESEVE